MYILYVCLTSLCDVLFNLLICDTEINKSINQVAVTISENEHKIKHVQNCTAKGFMFGTKCTFSRDRTCSGPSS